MAEAAAGAGAARTRAAARGVEAASGRATTVTMQLWAKAEAEAEWAKGALAEASNIAEKQRRQAEEGLRSLTSELQAAREESGSYREEVRQHHGSRATPRSCTLVTFLSASSGPESGCTLARPPYDWRPPCQRHVLAHIISCMHVHQLCT